jgi:hypothetical protein
MPTIHSLTAKSRCSLGVASYPFLAVAPAAVLSKRLLRRVGRPAKANGRRKPDYADRARLPVNSKIFSDVTKSRDGA